MWLNPSYRSGLGSEYPYLVICQDFHRTIFADCCRYALPISPGQGYWWRGNLLKTLLYQQQWFSISILLINRTGRRDTSHAAIKFWSPWFEIGNLCVCHLLICTVLLTVGSICMHIGLLLRLLWGGWVIIIDVLLIVNVKFRTSFPPTYFLFQHFIGLNF